MSVDLYHRHRQSVNPEEAPAVKRYRETMAAAEYEDATLWRRTKRRARALWRRSEVAVYVVALLAVMALCVWAIVRVLEAIVGAP